MCNKHRNYKYFTPPPPNLQSLDPRQLPPHARVGALVVLALALADLINQCINNHFNTNYYQY